MSKRYIFLAIVLLSTILLLALLPSKHDCNNEKRDILHLKINRCTGANPEEFLLNSLNNQRYIDVDDLAARIIEQDPSYWLIDLRDSTEFEKFSLPRSFNIPFEKLLDGNNIGLYQNNAIKKVLISNGTLQSDQAWMILNRKGYRQVKVLNGGLNEFFKILINPVKPNDMDPSEAFDTYSFRKAAGVYFGLPNPDDFIPEYIGGAMSGPSPNAGVSSQNANQKKSARAAPKKIEAPKVVIEEEGC